jgi:hypothetical protein
MLALPLLALAIQLQWDTSFDELTWVDLEQAAACSAKFAGGQIDFSYAFDEKARTMSPVMLISGRTTKRLRLGQRLYARFYSNSYRNALVVKATSDRATIVISKHAIGNILSEAETHLTLFESSNDMLTVNYGMLVFEESGPLDRASIVTALDCFDEEGD